MESLFGKLNRKWNGWSGKLIPVKVNFQITKQSSGSDFTQSHIHFYNQNGKCDVVGRKSTPKEIT